MDEAIIKEYCQKRGLPSEAVQKAIAAVGELESFLAGRGKTLASAAVPDIQAHIAGLSAENRITPDHLLTLARYFYWTGRNEIYIYFTALLNSQGVVGAISARIAAEEGETAANAVFDGVEMPPLGTPPAEMPDFTRRLMASLAARLPRGKLRRLLAGNNHEIPQESFLPEKAHYEKAASLDAYLADLHRRNVAELQEHCDSGKIWFEQVITQDVVDFAAGNPEILSAIRAGNKLYTTKIPFDTSAYLRAQTPEERRFHLCHCPFVRHALREPGGSLDADWCYCSGGFVKYPFEVILDKELEVELLESPLLGNDRCRFCIILPENTR
jgi:hypothetical protein